ncbi:flagellar basal body P-ring formation chaperone FlgA [Aquabacterium sp. A08]|uniref:flagellar basal body P-ring formation chaperone FlgA n=1 Tax=Aquabacterium sp. A08 TaxID=2718532 RepID=UPI00141E20BF|nr:flagellar basal body P-ring formation chaperone FlgA [Aquabacterium sp. A08]NIC40235.1 flagellar basal body P-ring formation protein FlgA [Aquabacterium sp. A08]
MTAAPWPLPTAPRAQPLVRLAAGAALALAAAAALAQAPAPAAAWTAQAQRWVQQELAGSAPGALPLRPEVEVGQLDRRLRLAPCQRVEPYLPAGTRLWGRSRIGLRCVDRPNGWNVFLPVTVRAWGPAWVVRRPVAPGTPLTAADADLTEIDWAEHPTPVLARTEDWLGQEAARALMPGQVLRQGWVRTPQVFSAGTPVRVQVRGPGFQLSASGQALTHGHVGQPARVRLPNRKVLTGTVRDADTVEVAL